MAVEYVVRGGKMTCSLGSSPRKINLPASHGSYVKGKPIMNKKDSTLQNVSSFGICKKTGEPCVPKLVGDWQIPKEDTLVEGKAALTKESIIFCCEGGKIKFETSGQ